MCVCVGTHIHAHKAIGRLIIEVLAEKYLIFLRLCDFKAILVSVIKQSSLVKSAGLSNNDKIVCGTQIPFSF